MLVREKGYFVLYFISSVTLFLTDQVSCDHYPSHVRPSPLPPIPVQLPPPPPLHHHHHSQLPPPLVPQPIHAFPPPFRFQPGSVRSATNMLPLLMSPPGSHPHATDIRSIIHGLPPNLPFPHPGMFPAGSSPMEVNQTVSLKDMITMESYRLNLLMNYLYTQQELFEAMVRQLEKISQAVNYSPSKDDLLYKLKNNIQIIPSGADFMEDNNNNNNNRRTKSRESLKSDAHNQGDMMTSLEEDPGLHMPLSGGRGGSHSSITKNEEAIKGMAARMNKLKKQIDRQKQLQTQIKKMSSRK